MRTLLYKRIDQIEIRISYNDIKFSYNETRISPNDMKITICQIDNNYLEIVR